MSPSPSGGPQSRPVAYPSRTDTLYIRSESQMASRVPRLTAAASAS